MTACINEGHNSYEYFFYFGRNVFFMCVCTAYAKAKFSFWKGRMEEMEKGGRM